MPSIQAKKFQWVRPLTARESVEAWRGKRKTMREDFESRTGAAQASFNTVWSNQSAGVADLGIKKALARIQAEIKAKAAEKAAASSVNELPKSRNSVFSVDSSATLDGGSKIDLKAGTLTLPNGTVVDLATGVKKLNIVT
jgi:hypothetical protein